MATGLGQTFRKTLFDYLFKATGYTNPAGVIYVGLHTGDPGVDGQAGNEVSTGGSSGYLRVVTSTASWNAGTSATPTVVTNAAVVTFPTNTTTNWGTVTYFSLWNTTIAGGTAAANFIGAGTINSQAIVVGNTPSFAISALSITISTS